MAGSIAVALALIGCGDTGSGFTGDYETVALESGACAAQGAAQPIADDERWFQLADLDTPTGLLVAYFPCVAAGDCSAEHDLYRSFGHDGARWVTTIALAIEPGCTLRYRERTLRRTGDTAIEIEDIAYEEVDPALSGAACAIDEARRRGTTMPCVEVIVQRAENRAF